MSGSCCLVDSSTLGFFFTMYWTSFIVPLPLFSIVVSLTTSASDAFMASSSALLNCSGVNPLVSISISSIVAPAGITSSTTSPSPL